MGSKRVVVLLMCVLAVSANSIPDQTPTEPTATVESTTSINVDDPTTAAVLTNITNIQLSEDLVKTVENNLYNSIVERKLDFAVEQTVRIYGKGYSSIIKKVVNRLIDDGITQVFDYAYKVAARAGFIARSCFPYGIRIHENLIFVKIVNYKYDMALRYSIHPDMDGDRNVYSTSDLKSRFEITWKFVPVWSGDRLYFKIRPINLAIFMKLGNTKDGDDDFGAYGSDNHDTDRHLWYVKPTRHNGKILFYIINKRYDAPLKLGKSVIDGYRIAYGNSDFYNSPDRFGWDIQVL